MSKHLPYDYMPFEEISEKKYSHEQKAGNLLTGSLQITVTVITPLVAVAAYEKTVPGQNPTQVIPGTSLRGALRSAAEILWNGTVSVINDRGIDREGIQFIKKEWRADEQTLKQHCAVSNLFGFIGKNNNPNDRRSIPDTLASKLRFSDAVAAQGTIKTETVNVSLYTPQAHPIRINQKKERHFLGRRVYLAGRMKAPSSGKNVNTKIAVKPGGKYTFSLYFRDVSEAQLADLIRLVELKPNCHHAFGAGKPYGYGRVEMKVESLIKKDKLYFLEESPGETGREELDSLLQRYENKHKKRYSLYYELIENEKFDDKKAYTGPDLKSLDRYFEQKQGKRDPKEVFSTKNKPAFSSSPAPNKKYNNGKAPNKFQQEKKRHHERKQEIDPRLAGLANFFGDKK